MYKEFWHLHFMQWLLVFFKISLFSCITVTVFARKVDLFMHWLLVFNKICLCNWLKVTRLILYLVPSWKIGLCFVWICFLDFLCPQISQINFRSSWKYLRWNLVSCYIQPFIDNFHRWTCPILHYLGMIEVNMKYY